MAAPIRKPSPARPLVALGVAIIALFGALGAGTQWSDATMTPKLALDLEGGTQIILTPVAESGEQITDATIAEAIRIIRQRVDSSGVAEAQITSQGSQGAQSIVVGIPGTPSQATLDLVRKSAQMRFRPVLVTASPTAKSTDSATPTPTPTDAASATPTDAASATPTDAATAMPTPLATPTNQPTDEPTTPPTSASDSAWLTDGMLAAFDSIDCADPVNLRGGGGDDPARPLVACDPEGAVKYVLGPVELEGSDIASAGSGLKTTANGVTTGEWVVNMQFTSSGTKKFADVTKRINGADTPLNQFAMVLDGLVISAPRVDNGAITDGRAEISGNFTRASAATLANQLNFGALPLTFTVQSEEQISATLGAEQLQRGLLAGLIGLVLVVIYSLIQYRGLGLVTVGSLLLAVVINYGLITLLSWTQGYRLSLPGVAGLIVAIGITADSFIVYFERVRDELRDGRGLPAAVEHGWTRARRTIIASDAVNFLAAAVLYLLAVGGVRGFAFTLGLTTLVDLLIVFTFTHPVLRLLARTKFFGEGHRFSGLDPRQLGSPGTRYQGRGRVSTPTVTTSGPVADDGARLTIAERRALAARGEASTDAAEAAEVAPTSAGSDD